MKDAGSRDALSPTIARFDVALAAVFPRSRPTVLALHLQGVMRRTFLLLASLVVACGAEPADDDVPVTAPDDEVVSRPPEKSEDPVTAPPAREPELRPTSLANLGDSISQGFDADDSEPIDLNALQAKASNVFKDAPELSWVQGTDSRVRSVASFYKAKNPSLVVTPFSRSGAEMVTTGGQPNFEDQAKALAKSGARPDLVYVLLGGNDICHKAKSKTSDATANLYAIDRWRDAVTRGLTTLAAALPEKAVVRIVSMPRVDLLYEVAKDRKVTARGTLNTPAGPVQGNVTKTCNELWTISATAGNGVCAIVTTEGDAARRAAIGQRIDAYNEATADEVVRFRADAAQNPKGIVFQTDWHGAKENESSIGTHRFTSEEVSARDCFHPSIAGQKAISTFVLERAKWR